MRAVMSKDGEVFVADTPLPDGNGVRVHVTNSGICGSDLHMVAFGLHGVILGHEFGGYTDDGRLVAVRPTGACGHCHPCATGHNNLCSDATAKLYGGFVHGGLADQVLVEPDRLVVMPEGSSPDTVALVEPLAVAIHGVSRAPITAGQSVLVVGGGSIGLLAVAALVDAGMSVDVSARHPHQQSAVEQLGGHNHVRDNYDVVFDAAATQSAFDLAVAKVRPGGTIIEYGMFWEPIVLNNSVMLKEITIAPAMYYNHHTDTHGLRLDQSADNAAVPDDFAAAADLVARTPAIASALVTHHFDLSDAKEAFAVANNREAGAIKVHLHP